MAFLDFSVGGGFDAGQFEFFSEFCLDAILVVAVIVVSTPATRPPYIGREEGPVATYQVIFLSSLKHSSALPLLTRSSDHILQNIPESYIICVDIRA